MFKFYITLLLIIFQNDAPDIWESKLDPFNGLTYLQAAEDLLSDGLDDMSEKRAVEHLYVLASVIDPRLRQHVILGLLAIQEEADSQQELIALLDSKSLFLVPQVVYSATTAKQLEHKNANELCEILSKVRKSQNLKTDEIAKISPWGFLLPESIESSQRNRRKQQISTKMLEATLQVELKILGGASIWSADFVSSRGRPVAFSINDDLATMFEVNPLLTIRKNGRWVAE